SPSPPPLRNSPAIDVHPSGNQFAGVLSQSSGVGSCLLPAFHRRGRARLGSFLRELRGARPLARGAGAPLPARSPSPPCQPQVLSPAALVPPSTGITVPVMKDASSEARKHARLAISSERPIRRNGARPTRRSRISASRSPKDASHWQSVGVSIAPGQMQF